MFSFSDAMYRYSISTHLLFVLDFLPFSYTWTTTIVFNNPDYTVLQTVGYCVNVPPGFCCKPWPGIIDPTCWGGYVFGPPQDTVSAFWDRLDGDLRGSGRMQRADNGNESINCEVELLQHLNLSQYRRRELQALPSTRQSERMDLDARWILLQAQW